MKKYLLLSICILIYSVVTAQKQISLSEDFLFDFEQFENGKGIIEIKKIKDFKLYQNVRQQLSRGLRPSADSISKSVQKDVALLASGYYKISNEKYDANFSIGQNHEFIDSAIIIEYGRNAYYNNIFYFENGLVTTAFVLAESGDTLTKMKSLDSVFSVQHYNKKKLVRQIDLNKDNGYNHSVFYYFYENGKIKSEDNCKLRYDKYYYENGILQSYRNKDSHESKTYDSVGVITAHEYPVNNGWCEESYENGLLKYKRTRTGSITKREHYINGKLADYEIEDGRSGTIKLYDNNHKLLKERQAIYPSVQMGQ